MTLKPLLALPILLMACVAANQPVAAPPMPADLASCGGNGLHSLVGQNAASLDLGKLAPVVRVIAPGMAITMDYSAQRLNLTTDAKGVIIGLSCG